MVVSSAATQLAEARDDAVPLVVDADALNTLATDPLMHADWILTPHPGEFARLTGAEPPPADDDADGDTGTVEALPPPPTTTATARPG